MFGRRWSWVVPLVGALVVFGVVLLTTPPMSSPAMEIASPGDCCAFNPLNETNRITPVAISGYETLLVMMFTSPGAE